MVARRHILLCMGLFLRKSLACLKKLGRREAPRLAPCAIRRSHPASRAECLMIRINDHLSLDEDEISESFIRASGPGGQNVNKLATAVQLRFDVRHSPSLPHEVRARLERLAGKRLTRDGVLVITAQRHRTQERNREDALDRLVRRSAPRCAASKARSAAPTSRPGGRGSLRLISLHY